MFFRGTLLGSVHVFLQQKSKALATFETGRARQSGSHLSYMLKALDLVSQQCIQTNKQQKNLKPGEHLLLLENAQLWFLTPTWRFTTFNSSS